jgi:isopenicillin-N epimerase
MLARSYFQGKPMAVDKPLCDRSLWGLDPQAIFLNHGSYGATPKTVLQAQRAWQERLEAQPVQFMGEELPRALRAAAAELAQFCWG